MVRICIIVSICILQSCFPIVFNRKYFQLNKSIEINRINTEGYYYQSFEFNQTNNIPIEKIRIRVFLNNGYTYYVGADYSNRCNEISELGCNIHNTEIILDNYQNFKLRDSDKRKSKTNLWNWGKYRIEGNTIFIQRFYNHFGDYYLLEEKGVVVDSNSFRLLKVKDYKTKKSDRIDEFYQFKNYNVKKLYEKAPNNL